MIEVNKEILVQIIQSNDMAIINEGTQRLDLKALILTKGYSVATIEEVDMENFDTVFVVINKNNDEQFQNTMIQLANLLSPTAVLHITKSGKEAYLHLANNNEILSLDDRINVGEIILNEEVGFIRRHGSKSLVFEVIQNFNIAIRYLISRRCGKYDI